MLGFVAYLRVSTDKQGIRGLGMAAQQETVSRHVASTGGTLIASYVEVESGKRSDNRPELARALALAKKTKATLLIAKLDRLSRNVAFISTLMESGVDLICADMPYANRLTLHILAAVGEHEREMISQRTKAALAQARARGVKLGRPGSDGSEARAGRSAKVAAWRRGIRPLAAAMEAQGMSRRTIAKRLNEQGHRTYAGREWRVQHVSALLSKDRPLSDIG